MGVLIKAKTPTSIGLSLINELLSSIQCKKDGCLIFCPQCLKDPVVAYRAFAFQVAIQTRSHVAGTDKIRLLKVMYSLI